MVWGNHVFKIKNTGTLGEAFVDGKKVFEAGKDLKIITDIKGKILKVKQLSKNGDISHIKVFL